MRRGDLVTVAVPGDYGKPRPALVIQTDRFSETGSLTVLLLSSTVRHMPLLRVTVAPTPSNGLHRVSQIMIDKTLSVKRDKVRDAFGRVGEETLLSVNRLLALFLGFA